MLTRVGNDFLALLVHGVFLASVPKPAEESAAVQIGDTLPFCVRSIEVSDGMLSLKGELGRADGKRARGEANGKETPKSAPRSAPKSSKSDKSSKKRKRKQSAS